MPVMPKEQIAEKLKKFEQENFIHHGFTFPFEYVEMNDEQLHSTLFNHRCSTHNFVTELRDQKIHDSSPARIAQIEELDKIFRWEFIGRENAQLFCFSVAGHALTKMRYPDRHLVMVRMYILLRIEKDCIIGLATHKSFQEA